MQRKIATISNSFLKAYKICSSEYIKEEIKFMYNVFRKLSFKNKTISNVHYKAKKRFYLKNEEPCDNNNKIFIVPHGQNQFEKEHNVKLNVK